MGKLSSEEANQLSNNFLGLAQAVGDYRFQNWNNLSIKDNQKLASFQWSLLNNGEDILVFSTQLVFEEVSESLQTIQSLTDKIKHSITKLENIQKAINIAASAVTLGAAIVSKDPKAITAGLKGFVEATKKEFQVKQPDERKN
jgi:hypothetical protein